MKILKTIACLLLFFACSFSAIGQSSTAEKAISKESFYLEIVVVNKTTFKITKLQNSKKKKVEGRFSNTSNLSRLNLAAGSVIEGIFRFDSFASEGGLGTTRVYSGKGKGTLNISKAVNGQGKKISCPPLCKKSVDIGLVLK
ncbi:MAG: hypothetical protein AAFO07_23925 [Bacteroidota bacterium]